MKADRPNRVRQFGRRDVKGEVEGRYQGPMRVQLLYGGFGAWFGGIESSL